MHNEQHDLNLELLITLVETPPHNNQAVTKLMYSKYLVSFILELFPPLTLSILLTRLSSCVAHVHKL